MYSETSLVAIVEDDDLVRSATVSLIRSLGLSSAAYASALDFLAAQPEQVGCIISDLHMPGMSGMELQQTLNANGSDVPFIMTTAYATDQVRSKALENGAYCFLEKPCRPEVLVDCLAGIFGPFDD
jgi:FixJ family two-component response regulator